MALRRDACSSLHSPSAILGKRWMTSSPSTTFARVSHLRTPLPAPRHGMPAGCVNARVSATPHGASARGRPACLPARSLRRRRRCPTPTIRQQRPTLRATRTCATLTAPDPCAPSPAMPSGEHLLAAGAHARVSAVATVSVVARHPAKGHAAGAPRVTPTPLPALPRGPRAAVSCPTRLSWSQPACQQGSALRTRSTRSASTPGPPPSGLTSPSGRRRWWTTSA